MPLYPFPEEKGFYGQDDKKYDLLILGTNGHVGLGRHKIGSITEKVIRQTPCSFITAKSEEVINLSLVAKVNSIEHHFKTAHHKLQLNMIDEAIGEYLICLNYNELHIPSLFGLAKAFGKKGEHEKEVHYKKMAVEIVNRLFKDHIKTE